MRIERTTVVITLTPQEADRLKRMLQRVRLLSETSPFLHLLEDDDLPQLVQMCDQLP